MTAIFVLFAAILTRILPFAFGLRGINLTAVGAGLLYFGARFAVRFPLTQALLATVLMASSDVFLTTVVYGMPFHLSGYLPTWAWYGAVCLLGRAMLHGSIGRGAWRVWVAALSSATSFFVVSNFVVWLRSGMYPRTHGGLLACYGAALPFYRNDLVSTAVVAGVLFGLPVLAERWNTSHGDLAA